MFVLLFGKTWKLLLSLWYGLKKQKTVYIMKKVVLDDYENSFVINTGVDRLNTLMVMKPITESVV